MVTPEDGYYPEDGHSGGYFEDDYSEDSGSQEIENSYPEDGYFSDSEMLETLISGIFSNQSSGSQEGVVELGENLLTDGDNFVAPLTEGQYVYALNRNSLSNIDEAYRFQISPGLSIPEFQLEEFNEGEEIIITLPTDSIDNNTLTWNANNLPEGLDLQENIVAGYLDDENFNGDLHLNLNAFDGIADKNFTFSVGILPIK